MLKHQVTTIGFITMLLCIYLCSCKGKIQPNPEKAITKDSLLSGNQKTAHMATADSLQTFNSPLVIGAATNGNSQVYFESIISNKLLAKLIPNNGRRQQLGSNSIKGVLGVTHFFLDHDLTTGYVHPYTTKFYQLLRPDDFVMKFDRLNGQRDVGYVYYVKRKELTANDTPGRNVAFFRQWRLSEVDYRTVNGKIEVSVAPSSFARGCVSPQLKVGVINPFSSEIKFWSACNQRGHVPLETLNGLGEYDGGTVVLIWQDSLTGETLFQDIHGSLQQVLLQAIAISKKYNADPAIAISDAGPMANKFLADKNNVLDGTVFPLQRVSFAGAGFGYVPQVVKQRISGGRMVTEIEAR